jgi:hypothetical protein
MERRDFLYIKTKEVRKKNTYELYLTDFDEFEQAIPMCYIADNSWAQDIKKS